MWGCRSFMNKQKWQHLWSCTWTTIIQVRSPLAISISRFTHVILCKWRTFADNIHLEISNCKTVCVRNKSYSKCQKETVHHLILSLDWYSVVNTNFSWNCVVLHFADLLMWVQLKFYEFINWRTQRLEFECTTICGCENLNGTIIIYGNVLYFQEANEKHLKYGILVCWNQKNHRKRTYLNVAKIWNRWIWFIELVHIRTHTRGKRERKLVAFAFEIHIKRARTKDFVESAVHGNSIRGPANFVGEISCSSFVDKI